MGSASLGWDALIRVAVVMELAQMEVANAMPALLVSHALGSLRNVVYVPQVASATEIMLFVYVAVLHVDPSNLLKAALKEARVAVVPEVAVVAVVPALVVHIPKWAKAKAKAEEILESWKTQAPYLKAAI